MIDGNQLREEFGRYLAEHKATRWGMDAALMHVCKIAYDAGRADGPATPERRIGPASDADMAVYQSIADGYTRDTAPAPAGVPMPKPVAYGFGNTAITGHTNRLMMVRIDIPGGDQYAGAFWLPLVLADEAHTYGVACRAAGEAAGYARGLRDAGHLPNPLDPANGWPQVSIITSGTTAAPDEKTIVALRGEVKP